MAKIPGGITSRPSGKLGNIIFGAARTPAGKVATAREAVDPSNPNTAAQQSQRSKFSQAVNIVQGVGPSVYQEDWNRAVGQLPGFQSWQSMLLNNIDQNDDLQPPDVRPLGNLHFPDSFSASSSDTSGSIDVSWSGELGDNGTDADDSVLLAIEQAQPASRERDVVTIVPGQQRSAQSATINTNQPGNVYVIGLYFRGAGNAEGLLSPADFTTATAFS